MTKLRSRMILALIFLAALITAAVLYKVSLPSSSALPALEAQLDFILPEYADDLSGIDACIAETAAKEFSVRTKGEITQRYRRAAGNVLVTQLDIPALTEGIAAQMQTLVTGYVNDASRPTDVYDENGCFLPEVSERAYREAMEKRLETPEAYLKSSELPVSLRYKGRQWQVDSPAALEALARLDFESMPGYADASAALEYVEFHYRLRDWTSPGPVPSEDCFGETDDPQVILALLESETARKLINGQTLDFDPEELLPGRSIHYYLDETILSLVWQEEEHGAIGTFAETFIADASQLRRKIADDTFRALSYYFPTVLAEQANAVVAVSGDFYDHPDRIFGIYAYNGQVMLSSLTKGQSCFFTDEGDMLFTYENQFATDEEAQKFMDENHAMFSVSFGPVMVENGVDVTPYDYPLGEVRDTYARCAIGQLGHLHYLAMTINVEVPDHNVYVTLRQAADSMIAHGCINAYTLDGGQTGSIIINNQLINPVQFGKEREKSDIIYFATAMPNR